MSPLLLASLAVGTIAIRFLHRVRRALSGSNGYFSFSDLLVDDRIVEHRGFLWMSLPPLLGGGVLYWMPGSDSIIAAAAGFLAAFLGVWPVYRFPFHVLDEDLQPYWPKLRYLYLLFIGSSAGLAYLGFSLMTMMAPLGHPVVQSGAWKQFTDNVAANGLYDLVKYLLTSLLIVGGVSFNSKRKQIGAAAANAREDRLMLEYGEPEERG